MVHDSEPKLPWVIPEFHFDRLGLRVPEGILQRLAGDMINLVPDQWREVPALPFDVHTKLGTTGAGVIGREAYHF